MNRMVPALLTALLCAGVARCSRAEAPSGLLTGTWTGTIVESGRGSGNATLVLDQRGQALTGALETTFQGVVDRDGPVTGTASGSSSTIYFTPPEPIACGGGVQMSGTVAFTLQLTGVGLSGSYAGLTCGGAVGGTVDLRLP